MQLNTSDPFGFNDEKHLVNFINYLLRTDKAQKWTCDDTVNNCISLPKINSEFVVDYFSHNLDDRKLVASSIKIIATNQLAAYKKNISSLENSRYVIELDPGEILENKDYKTELFNISKYLDTLNKNEKTICYTLHSDQEEGLHVHRLYINI